MFYMFATWRRRCTWDSRGNLISRIESQFPTPSWEDQWTDCCPPNSVTQLCPSASAPLEACRVEAQRKHMRTPGDAYAWIKLWCQEIHTCQSLHMYIYIYIWKTKHISFIYIYIYTLYKTIFVHLSMSYTSMWLYMSCTCIHVHLCASMLICAICICTYVYIHETIWFL